MLPQPIKQAAATKAINRINASTTERAARYGDLASVDLTSAVVIDTQVQALPFPEKLKLPSDHPIVIFNVPRQRPISPILLRQQNMSKLELRIHKVKCLDETSGLAGTESGTDEIDLGGTTVDESGDAEKVDPFRVRSDFEDGVEQIYWPPKQFASFDLTEGTDFPKSYFVTLVLAEMDNGGLPDVLHKLLMWVKEKVTTALAAAIGGLIGVSGGPIGAAIGAAVGAAVGLIIDFIKDVWEDDAFKPATVRVDIPSLDARWPGDMTDSPEGIITYKGHGGEYQVIFDWHLFGQAVLPPATQGVIYAIEPTRLDLRTGARSGGRLLWYRHDGRGDGSFTWAQGSGSRVDGSWNKFNQVFSGGDGIIYAIEHVEPDPRTGARTGGHLLWFRYDRRDDGSFTRAPGFGNQVGRGWGGFKQVFPGGDGVIYAIQENGDLLWYRHDGRGDGSFVWAQGSKNRVGNGWNFSHVFAG
ncbi:MAG: tachylectin-related carbohydrate-binding protein [Nitrospira sp.]